MQGSFNASEPAQPNAITPIAAAPATGRFPRRSLRSEAKRKPQAALARGAKRTPRICVCIQHSKILLN